MGSMLEYVAYNMPSELGATMRVTAIAAMDNAFVEVLPRGFTPIPQVFVFDRVGEQQLVGHIICRRYERGADAIQAVAHLGRIAAAVAGTDLLVTWEEADLEGPSPAAPAFAILEAAFDYHALTLVPFYRRVVGREADGQNKIKVVRDQPTDTYEGAALPSSVDSLLHLWRTCLSAYDWNYSRQVLANAAQTGYEIALCNPAG
ncbi:hypothetical protein Mycch_5411 (plasmid) [Mycolicibacterium chubuense NBB4]|uniref:Uncharacterized protein n=2 Tax=Mycobacteriaceae TaxID=1762 RepID=I4BS28_MYCCN|nr:hypothetical protein Mycch_5411 [Mycolicibacterium chubuense NBB4]